MVLKSHVAQAALVAKAAHVAQECHVEARAYLAEHPRCQILEPDEAVSSEPLQRDGTESRSGLGALLDGPPTPFLIQTPPELRKGGDNTFWKFDRTPRKSPQTTIFYFLQRSASKPETSPAGQRVEATRSAAGSDPDLDGAQLVAAVLDAGGIQCGVAEVSTVRALEWPSVGSPIEGAEAGAVARDPGLIGDSLVVSPLAHAVRPIEVGRAWGRVLVWEDSEWHA